MFNLNLACRPLWLAGFNVYLVGSCLHRAGYRDVDLRSIVPDDDHYRMFGSNRMMPHLFGVAISEWIASRTSLPIDFQFQRQTEANAEFDGERHAIGMEAGEWTEPCS